MDQAELERQFFERGKSVLGRNAGGLLANLLRAKSGNVALARAELERATTKENPREWLAKVARPKATGMVGNGAAEAWRIRAAAMLADRKSAKVPTAQDIAAVAKAHAQFKRQVQQEGDKP